MKNTNCLIAVRGINGETATILCHEDATPGRMKKLLSTHYNTIYKVSDLLSLGDLIKLEAQLSPSEGQHHTADNPAPGVTIAMARDAGRVYHAPRSIGGGVNGLVTLAKKAHVQWVHVFYNGAWHCRKGSSVGF